MTETDLSRQFLGKYRGAVVNPEDPLKMGRLLVKVPELLSEIPTFWAVPATPYGGTACGMYVVPPPNAGVWVEFEGGDPERPIWTGFYRDDPSETPPIALTQAPGVPQVTISTPTQNTLIISDVPGPTGGIQIQLHAPAGPFIKLNETGVEISAGSGIDPAGRAVGHRQQRRAHRGRAGLAEGVDEMPGLFFHQGAVMSCPHEGVATIAVPSQPRVKVGGMPVAVMGDQIVVAGCVQIPPDTKVEWVQPSVRVKVLGRPVMLQPLPTGPATAATVPTAVPPIVKQMQPRVRGM